MAAAPLPLPPENRRGAKMHVAAPRVERRRMVVLGQRARGRRLRPGRNRPAPRTPPIARAFARPAPAGSRRRARLLRERQILAEPRAVGEPVVARELQRPVDRFQPLGHGARAERGRERGGRGGVEAREVQADERRVRAASRRAAIPGLARARPPAPDRRSRGRRRSSRRRRGSAAGRCRRVVTSRCGSRSSSSSRYRVSSGSEGR